jgi:hypothetical protein
LITPAPPTNKALTAPRSVESLGVTVASFDAENKAPGLEGVKSLAIIASKIIGRGLLPSLSRLVY